MAKCLIATPFFPLLEVGIKKVIVLFHYPR